MNNTQKTMPFARILQNIKDELEEENPKFTQIIEEALSKDGTLALKSKLGQKVEIRFLPEKKDSNDTSI